MKTLDPLTKEQETALKEYAAKHGKAWKAKLNDQWCRASAPPILHALRNTHGPEWLITWRLP